jgi:hypothetical protein
MEALSSIAEILRDLLIFVAVMAGLLIVLIVVIAWMPEHNPLKRLLTALSFRVGATVAAGALAIPIEPIPGLDVLYDIGAPLLLLLYWVSFFRRASGTISDPYTRRVRQPATTGGHSPPQNRSVAKDIIRRVARL